MGRLDAKSIDRKRWLAALHVKAADDMLNLQMEQAESLLLEAVRPKGVYRIMAREEVNVEGFSIEKHLKDCHQVILMAVTLGAETDALLRRMQVSDMALAVIADAGASVLTEQICDEFETSIKHTGEGETQAASRLYFTSRFSPGYGDYPVQEQKRVLQYLEAQKKIGLHVTRDSLMIPGKSITALIGAAHHPVAGRMADCSECILKEKCTIGKEGRFCGNKF